MGLRWLARVLVATLAAVLLVGIALNVRVHADPPPLSYSAGDPRDDVYGGATGGGRGEGVRPESPALARREPDEDQAQQPRVPAAPSQSPPPTP